MTHLKTKINFLVDLNQQNIDSYEHLKNSKSVESAGRGEKLAWYYDETRHGYRTNLKSQARQIKRNEIPQKIIEKGVGDDPINPLQSKSKNDPK